MYFTMLKIVSGCTMGEKKYIVLQGGIYYVYFGKKKKSAEMEFGCIRHMITFNSEFYM